MLQFNLVHNTCDQIKRQQESSTTATIMMNWISRQ